MTWDAGVPDETLTAHGNTTKFTDNWDYIEAQMKDDHYWYEDASKDGHHRKMSVDDIANTGTALTGSDPTNIDAGTSGMYYVRAKTSTEASEAANQLVNPYYCYRDSGDTTSFYKQLGFSAIVTFRVNTSTGAIITNGGNNWDYQHNVSSVTVSATSTYTITFTNPMPNANYAVLCTAESSGNSGSLRRFASVLAGGKAAGSVIVQSLGHNSNNDLTRLNPSSMSVIVIGA